MAERVNRIAVVIPKYGLVGGAEGFAAELTERLANNPRFEFHVFANRWVSCSDRIAFHRVPIISFPKFLTTPSFAFFADRQIRRAGIDLIHTHDRIFRADMFTMHGVPHRFWVREVRRKRMSLYDRVTALVEDRLIGDPRCRFFMPVSCLAEAIFMEEYVGVAPERIRVVHPGIDPGRYKGLDRISCREALAGRFGIAPEERLILFVSMNFEVKGLDALMEGLAVLARQAASPLFRLLVVGKGNVRKYRKLASSLGIGGRVLFTGVLPGAELPTLYAAADLYIMLSRFDTFGMVILEAMAASLPVIVSDRVGAKDLVRDGINGFIIPVDAGPEEISSKLAFLFHREVREQMGVAARETAMAKSWDRAAERIASLYEELLMNPAG